MMTRLPVLVLVTTCVFAFACGEDVEQTSDWELDDELEDSVIESAWAYHIPTGVQRTGINIELSEPEICVVFLIVGLIDPGQTFELGGELDYPTPGVVEGSCDNVMALTRLPDNAVHPQTAEGEVTTHGTHRRGHAKFFDVDVTLEFDTSDASFLPQELSVQAKDIGFRSH